MVSSALLYFVYIRSLFPCSVHHSTTTTSIDDRCEEPMGPPLIFHFLGFRISFAPVRRPFPRCAKEMRKRAEAQRPRPTNTVGC